MINGLKNNIVIYKPTKRAGSSVQGFVDTQMEVVAALKKVVVAKHKCKRPR